MAIKVFSLQSLTQMQQQMELNQFFKTNRSPKRGFYMLIFHNMLQTFRSYGAFFTHRNDQFVKSHKDCDLLNAMNFYPIYCLFLESQFVIPSVLGIERKSFFDSPFGEVKKIEVKARPHFRRISPPKMR